MRERERGRAHEKEGCTLMREREGRAHEKEGGARS